MRGTSDAGLTARQRSAPLLLRRVAAYGLDMLLLFAVLAPTNWLVQRGLGLQPEGGHEVWGALLLGFSLPAWAYFAVADASAGGATWGKRRLGLKVGRAGGGRPGRGRALLRTAVKLLPWEVTHLAAFGLAPADGTFSDLQAAGLVLANGLALAWLATCAASGGRRAPHDVVARTEVGPA